MANIKRNQLSPLKLQNLREAGTYVDGAGLMFRVRPGGGKSWIMRLTVGGKRRNFGMGGYPAVGLKDAREKAAELREWVEDGGDPADYLEAQRAERAATPTFGEAAEKVIALRAPTWTSPRHATQWRESLRLHAMPRLGPKPVDAITTADVLSILTPIWNSKPETAGRVKQRMAVVFDFAIAAGWRTDNPCNGALKAALPQRSRQRRHHPALPYVKVGAALDAVRNTAGRESTRLGLEFLILTAARAGEVRQATWDEVDFDSCVWTVPEGHMKARRPHRVPLSTAAVDVLKQAHERSWRGLVFPSSRPVGQPLSNMAFTMLLRRAGYDHVTTHGFRASFRTWALEQTDTPWAVAEAALAHNLGGGEVMAYARSDLFERRRALMQEWADYVNTDG